MALGLVLRLPCAAADAVGAAEDAPGVIVSAGGDVAPGAAPVAGAPLTGGAVRNGAVVTPPSTLAPATAGASPGADRRSTCPTRIRLTFSMLFQAASSR